MNCNLSAAVVFVALTLAVMTSLSEALTCKESCIIDCSGHTGECTGDFCMRLTVGSLVTQKCILGTTVGSVTISQGCTGGLCYCNDADDCNAEGIDITSAAGQTRAQIMFIVAGLVALFML